MKTNELDQLLKVCSLESEYRRALMDLVSIKIKNKSLKTNEEVYNYFRNDSRFPEIADELEKRNK